MIRRSICLFVLAGLLMHSYSGAQACGPSYVMPIFVFERSPDFPFGEFVAGKIGIVRPTFGRKTLLIAYRYLNGGSFTPGEQQALVSALEGATPEADDNNAALMAWVEARKEYLREEEPPEIYTERRAPYGRYDFFPNCARNAFEVATQTLRDRVNSYGPDDANVREWLRGQDEVFQNCSAGSASIPSELVAGPAWLRKDRDYQIAAALFYSMQFDEAIARFEKIAGNVESDWQETAEYLVARTLVRQASLTDDQPKQAKLYAEAERRLGSLIVGGNNFRDAARKLLGLVKYRIHPAERVAELAELVSHNDASLDLRQDVIDYVWLLDKFEGQVLKAEHERQEALKKKDSEGQETLDAVATNRRPENFDFLDLSVTPRLGDGTYDWRNTVSIQVQYDTPETEILRRAEEKLGRPLTADESHDLKSSVQSSLQYRRWRSSYNRRLDAAATTYEGCDYCYDLKLKLADVPAFLTENDVTDWIFTLQLEGPETYAHALEKWRQSDSPAWLAVALIKAETTSPGVTQLMRAAQRLGPNEPASATIFFHLVRLKMARGETAEARKLLESFWATQGDQLPLSTQNEFRGELMQMATDLTQFMRFAGRKPAAIYHDGLYKSIREMIESEKAAWSYDNYQEPRDTFEARIDRFYRDLDSDDLKLFDESTSDIVDRHLPLSLLQQAAKDPQLSSYLRRRFSVAVWTRAVLLDRHDLANQITPDLIKLAPEMTALLTEYLNAKTAVEREHTTLYIFLKFPGLTPFVSGDLSQASPYEDSEYYLESAWWCKPVETEYRNGNEVPKVVAAPSFLNSTQLEEAQRQFAALSEIGDAKSFLGQQVLKWAEEAPDDPRLPEALFIAVKANESYKYGCNGWQFDEEIQAQAKALLREKYPNSPWTAKLGSENDP
jgi:hypothetical protein